jgi:hypothetical protein
VRPILCHLCIFEHPPHIAPPQGPPQTELLAINAPSPWDRGNHSTIGRDPLNQSLPRDDGTWSA